MELWSIEALSFLAWLLGRSCFFSPLYWGRHRINRHTGNRPSLSEEPLRRGPGPIARFPTLRYRPEHYRHLDCNDVLWNPFTFWEEVVVNTSFKSFESARFSSSLSYREVWCTEIISKIPPAAKTFTHLLSIYSSMPHLLCAMTSMAVILYSVCRSVYLFFSSSVLNNVVAIMLYMNGHVFPKDFHVPHKALMNDDLTISLHICRISDDYAIPGNNLWGMKHTFDWIFFIFDSAWEISLVTFRVMYKKTKPIYIIVFELWASYWLISK